MLSSEGRVSACTCCSFRINFTSTMSTSRGSTNSGSASPSGYTTSLRTFACGRRRAHFRHTTPWRRSRRVQISSADAIGQHVRVLALQIPEVLDVLLARGRPRTECIRIPLDLNPVREGLVQRLHVALECTEPVRGRARWIPCEIAGRKRRRRGHRCRQSRRGNHDWCASL